MRANKVKSLSPNHRSVIALHSPSAAEFLCNPDCVAEREGFSQRPLLSTASLINHLFSLYGTLCYPVEPLFSAHLPYYTVLRIGMKSLNFPGSQYH